MFKKILLFTFAAVAAVRAAPASSRDLLGTTVKDTDVLNYALTLEHLENAFYRTALAQYDERAFSDAGYTSDVRKRFVQIGQHEQQHVNFLSNALGRKATKACEYSFPIPTVRAFTLLSTILENLGVSAYAGAAKYIKSASYLTSAATILSVEARHASWGAANANYADPFPQAFDTPLPASAVLIMSLQFVLACPSSNPTLPFDIQPFPTLALSDDSPAPGASIVANVASVNDTGAAAGGPTYVAWLNDSGVAYSKLGPNGETTVPQGLNGTVYALAVSSKDAGIMPNAENMVSGLAVAHISKSDA